MCDNAGMGDLVGTKGGSGVWQRIISEMPAHRVYIEPFWGRGTIARKKRPADITVALDLDPAAIADAQQVADFTFCANALTWLREYFGKACDVGFSGGSKLLGGYRVDEHLVYLDPPYYQVPNYYKHGLSELEHGELLRLFHWLPCPAMLSGYWREYYADRLVGTRAAQIPTTNRAGRRVMEWVWFNFPKPAAGRYHDVRYVGAGRRERERIRRRVKTWQAGLDRMPPQEQQAVWEAMRAPREDAGENNGGRSTNGH